MDGALEIQVYIILGYYVLLCVLHMELGHFFGLYAGEDEYQHHDEFAIFSIILIVPNLSGWRRVLTIGLKVNGSYLLGMLHALGYLF